MLTGAIRSRPRGDHASDEQCGCQAPAGRCSAGPAALFAALALTLALGAGCTTTLPSWPEMPSLSMKLPPPSPPYGQDRVLDDATIAKVQRGMTRDQVRALLGTPGRIGSDVITGQEEWMWRYNRLHIETMCFFARFNANGLVNQTSTKLELVVGATQNYQPC